LEGWKGAVDAPFVFCYTVNTKELLMEKIQFTLFRMFECIACNPEWWFVQYAPVFFSAFN